LFSPERHERISTNPDYDTFLVSGSGAYSVAKVWKP
jgi:3'-phosphoadenosine 5'-phosphosulfate sulfotransferase